MGLHAGSAPGPRACPQIRLRGASLIIGVDPLAEGRPITHQFGAGITLDPTRGDVVAEIKALTAGRGVDVALEALGRQETFEAALRSIRRGGVSSSLGVCSGKLVAPYEAVYAGLGDQRIVTTLYPGGKERMRRLMSLLVHERVDYTPLVTHAFTLEELPNAFDLFSHPGVVEDHWPLTKLLRCNDTLIVARSPRPAPKCRESRIADEVLLRLGYALSATPSPGALGRRRGAGRTTNLWRLGQEVWTHGH